jgi:hypothetical protein
MFGDNLFNTTATATPVKVRPLKGDVKYIHAVLADGQTRTLRNIQAAVQERFDVTIPLESVGARLRDLRKPAFGSLNVVKVGTGREPSYQLAA